MAISLKCRMCGGDLDVADGESVAECEYCGSKQTVPRVDDERRLQLFARASKLLRACEFDKAAGIYEQVLADDADDAEAHWGLVLCRYGIEYVDDPATGAKVPTCHRSSFDCVMDDEDLELACENADAAARRLYREQAKEIERLRAAILEVSEGELPYDVFICYKETDPVTGERTVDSVIAQDVYEALSERGYRVFFSRITLEGMLGSEYEPVIFAALNSAKVMLAFGTDYEYFEAVWVKNEWSRFLRLAASDRSKHLVPCYKGIDPYDLPKEFRALQGQDMGKVGAVQDLLRGVEKLVGKKKVEAAQPQVVQQVVAGGPNNEALLQRARMALEDGDWDAVGGFCEQVLNSDAQCAEAYLCKLMAKLECSSAGDLAKQAEPFDSDPDCQKAVRFGDEALKRQIAEANVSIRERNRERDREAAYADADNMLKEAVSRSDFDAAISAFRKLDGYKDAPAKAQACADEWAQIEERAKAIAQGYVNLGKRASEKSDGRLSGLAFEVRRWNEKLNVAQGKLENFNYAVLRVSKLEAEYAGLEAEKAGLEAELRGLGLFKGARKKELTEKVSRIEAKLDTARKSLADAEKRLSSFESEERLKGAVSEASARLAEAKEWESDAQNAERAKKSELEAQRAAAMRELKTVLADPRALLYAESLRRGILDSMERDPAVWPLIRRTPYLYELTDEGKKKEREGDLRAERLQMGKWNGAPLSWRMLKKEGGRALVVCSEVVERRPYHGSRVDVTWEKCDLRKWLNGGFLNSAFADAERARIVELSIKNPGSARGGTKGGAATRDRVFCLSIDEANELFKGDAERKCGPSAHVKKEGKAYMTDDRSGARWWLRSPGSSQYRAAGVNDDGNVNEYGWYVNNDSLGVRPAFWLNLES